MRKSANPSELGFTIQDRNRLAKALDNTDEARLFRRIQAVLLVAKGRTFSEVSEITGLWRSSVYNLVNRYLESHQVATLQDMARSGRPSVAPCITDQRILRELQRKPLLLGYNTNVWTVDLLAEHLNGLYACSITARTLRRRMNQLDLHCKRPRYVYSEKDPHRAQKKGRLFGN
jgi:transposase